MVYLSKEILFVCYPRCGTCKKARTWLDNNNIEYKERDIKEDNPTKEELSLWFEKSGYPLKKFFNTSGLRYRELNLKDKLKEMSDQEQIELLASDGMLVKRPIVVTNDIVIVGFKEEEWENKLL
ncbi:MAG: arsenate reductase family protein [Clostridiales bacterium]|nr:arsenate reductase family protein [Clostridiales bacterium]